MARKPQDRRDRTRLVTGPTRDKKIARQEHEHDGTKRSVEEHEGDHQLVNDEDSPKADHYYGTDDAATRGYHPFPNNASDPHGNEAHDPDFAPSQDVPGVVFHGADNAAARPVGYSYVIWRGSVEPDNAEDEDVWQPDDLEEQHNHDSRYLTTDNGGTAEGDIIISESVLDVERTVSGALHTARVFPSAVDGRVLIRHRVGASPKAQIELGEEYVEFRRPGTQGDLSVRTDHGFVGTQMVAASDSRQQNTYNSDFRATGSGDHVAIQDAIDALEVGTK